jgi:hypothetical protein
MYKKILFHKMFDENFNMLKIGLDRTARTEGGVGPDHLAIADLL